MMNLEQQKSNDLELKDAKKITLQNTMEEINRAENNEYPEDPELQNAENIIKNWWDISKITKLNKELAHQLIEQRNFTENDSLILSMSLTLDWLKTITPEVAKELSKFPWTYLSLQWLNQIEGVVIDELSKFNWQLVFNDNEFVNVCKYAQSQNNEILKSMIMDKRKYLKIITSSWIMDEVEKHGEGKNDLNDED